MDAVDKFLSGWVTRYRLPVNWQAFGAVIDAAESTVPAKLLHPNLGRAIWSVTRMVVVVVLAKLELVACGAERNFSSGGDGVVMEGAS